MTREEIEESIEIIKKNLDLVQSGRSKEFDEEELQEDLLELEIQLENLD